MDAQASFPGEPWISTIQSLFPRPPRSRSSILIPLTIDDMSIFATISLYIDIQDSPCRIIQCPLAQNHLGTYSICRTSAIQVSRAIRDLCIESISASIFAVPLPHLHHLTGSIPLATLDRTWLISSLPYNFVDNINETININNNNNNNNNAIANANANANANNNNNNQTNSNNNNNNDNNNNNNALVGGVLMSFSENETMTFSSRSRWNDDDNNGDYFTFTFTPAHMSLVRMSAG
jgi:hypothetical protein